MLGSLFAGLSDWGLVALRVMLGAAFIIHGWPKVNPRSHLGGTRGWAMSSLILAFGHMKAAGACLLPYGFLAAHTRMRGPALG